jgi:2-polyprenyl-3-methyl-5-hydroxy-6-metoxy-1,4-benzoquinol methylase
MNLIEDKACIICGNIQRAKLSSTGRYNEKLNTVMCSKCGLIHSSPIPSSEELENFYKNEYRLNYKSSYQPKLKHTIRYASGSIYHFKNMMKYIKESKGKSFLDLGAGSGEILYFAKKEGFKVLGIEPNNGYASYCKNLLSLPIINNVYEKANIKKDSYDVIHLNEVLEHMRDPIVVLNDIYSFLKPDGIAFINVPDIELDMHAPSTRFHYAHIYNYNHITLKKLIQKCGFEILNLGTNTTKIVAKKNLSNQEYQDVKLDGNFENLYNKLVSKSNLYYSLTVAPIRIVKKLFLYPKEIIQTKIFYKDTISILEGIYNRGNADLIVRIIKSINDRQIKYD